jgi:glucosamine--fructose-6-phosphate aminotransferase (isomerizing)
MCGIVGYVGNKKIQDVLIEGLERLEYRGYDSAGIALLPKGKKSETLIRRCVGRVAALKEVMKDVTDDFEQGIAHTRWATHGVPSETNAHPHRAGRIYLVHNGIIENYLEIKEELLKDGNTFESQTDTEVFAHLIERELRKVLNGKDFDSLSTEEKTEKSLEALRNSSKLVEGHYAVLLMVAGLDGVLMGVQAGAPLVAAQTKGELFVASDLQALLSHINQMHFLPAKSIFSGSTDGLNFYDMNLQKKEIPKTKIDWSPDKIAKGGYEHFMLKEIYEQSAVVADTLSGRLPNEEQGFIWDFPEVHEVLWKNVDRVVLVACGTAYYAAMTAKYFFEKWAKIQVDVDLASEFRYRSPVLGPNTIVGVITQSGETADTLAALRLAIEKKVKTFAVCNVPASSIAREADVTYPTKAGPEIGVASTKAFTTQLTILSALAQDLGRERGANSQWREHAEEMARLPHFIETVLARGPEFLKIGGTLERFKTLLVVGRGLMYPIALEGALKIKEISYRHAEGYAAGELKHGPIALIDSSTCAIVLSPKDELSAKSLSNLQEMKARSGWIIGIGEESHESFKKECNEFISLPKSPNSISPMLYVIPLQLLAYGLAKKLGCDIDKPRNLAKSVTVE